MQYVVSTIQMGSCSNKWHGIYYVRFTIGLSISEMRVARTREMMCNFRSLDVTGDTRATKGGGT